MRKSSLAALLLFCVCLVASPVDARRTGVNYVSKVFRDGAYLPYVYDEGDVVNRYGPGKQSVDRSGLIRRLYRDAVSGFEVRITSNPDVAAEFRTIDEIRVSSVASGYVVLDKVEPLTGISLKGVRIGDPLERVHKAVRSTMKWDSIVEQISGVPADRVCGYQEDGSNICYYVRLNKVVAMAVGFGP